ncbi:MAG: hypothetical protein GY786_12000 [Proteobacteria bacterium]|nr:hypothetical protein [Pseudomonadota bacterium]
MEQNHKLEHLTQDIAGLFKCQEEALTVYEENLHSHFDFTRTLSSLFTRQLELLQQNNSIPQTVLSATALLQEHHAETQRVSRQFQSQQTEFVRLASDLLKNQFIK